MPHVEHDTGVLLSHSDKREVLGGVCGREKTDERLILEQNKRAPRLEVVEELRGSYTTLDGCKSVVSRRREQISGEISVLIEDKNNLISMEPSVPQIGVNCTEM